MPLFSGGAVVYIAENSCWIKSISIYYTLLRITQVTYVCVNVLVFLRKPKKNFLTGCYDLVA